MAVKSCLSDFLSSFHLGLFKVAEFCSIHLSQRSPTPGAVESVLKEIPFLAADEGGVRFVGDAIVI